MCIYIYIYIYMYIYIYIYIYIYVYKCNNSRFGPQNFKSNVTASGAPILTFVLI